jgi:hypothetical protein
MLRDFDGDADEIRETGEQIVQQGTKTSRRVDELEGSINELF